MGKKEPHEAERTTTCEATFLFVSVVLIFGGIALLVSRFAQKSSEWRLQGHLVIKEDSEMLNTWEHPKFPTLMKYYIFNVTNGIDILKGKRPILTEHGPYTYVMYSPRVDVQFGENHTVSYRNNNTLRFDRSQSVGSESDLFNHINIPAITVAEILWNTGTSMNITEFRKQGSGWIRNNDLIESHTVKEIIFGYDDAKHRSLNDIMGLAGKKLDSTFGPFQGFNNSDDGLFLVDTGVDSFKNYTVIRSWNNNTELSCWSDKYANMINGTDGSFLRPRVKRQDSRYLYSPQMHRSTELRYEVDSEYKGVETLRFHFADDLLTNASAVPANKGFCIPKCYESGLLNVGACDNGTAPIFLSLPHFYQGSLKLVNDVGGMNPDKKLHDSYFHVEPVTGAVLLSQKRYQINAHVGKQNSVPPLSKIKSVFFPYLWVSEETTISDDMVEDLHKSLTIIRVVAYSGVVVIAIGLIMLVATLVKKHRRIRFLSKAEADEELLIPSPSTSVEEA